MSKIKDLAQLALALLIVGGFIAVIALVADGLGAWDVYRAQQEARQAEAKARELEAQAAVLRAKQAMLQTAVVSFASAKDSLLVMFTYVLGGLSLFLALIAVGVLLLERGKGHDRHL